jgi:hypothetical protein
VIGETSKKIVDVCETINSGINLLLSFQTAYLF